MDLTPHTAKGLALDILREAWGFILRDLFAVSLRRRGLSADQAYRQADALIEARRSSRD